VTEAKEACNGGSSAECAAAWDVVEEISAANSHAKAKAKVRARRDTALQTQHVRLEWAPHAATPLRPRAARARSRRIGRQRPGPTGGPRRMRCHRRL
jgi:hypothetical protein